MCPGGNRVWWTQCTVSATLINLFLVVFVSIMRGLHVEKLQICPSRHVFIILSIPSTNIVVHHSKQDIGQGIQYVTLSRACNRERDHRPCLQKFSLLPANTSTFSYAFFSHLWAIDNVGIGWEERKALLLIYYSRDESRSSHAYQFIHCSSLRDNSEQHVIYILWCFLFLKMFTYILVKRTWN